MTTTPIKLSGSTDGAPIKVTGTNSGGAVTIHTAHATNLDYITLFADNDDSSNLVTLTLEIGGTTDPDNLLKVSIPARGADGDGRRCVLLNQVLTNSKTVKAFASSANKIKISGTVTRYS